MRYLPLAAVTNQKMSFLQECAGECRNRSSSMKSTEDFWSKKKFADPTAAVVMMEEDRQLDQWLLGRQQRMGTYSTEQGWPFLRSAMHAL